MFSSQKDDGQKKPPITITTRKKNTKREKYKNYKKKRGQPRLSEVPYRKHGADNQRLPCYLGFYKKLIYFIFIT